MYILATECPGYGCGKQETKHKKSRWDALFQTPTRLTSENLFSRSLETLNPYLKLGFHRYVDPWHDYLPRLFFLCRGTPSKDTVGRRGGSAVSEPQSDRATIFYLSFTFNIMHGGRRREFGQYYIVNLTIIRGAIITKDEQKLCCACRASQLQ